MIIDEMKKQNLLALKTKNHAARTIYSILINKYNLLAIENKVKGKETDDTDAIRLIQKTVKELTEEASNYKKVNNLESEQDVLKQRELLEGYLPKMLSGEEIKTIINELDDKSIPNVMRHFKMNFAGKCDMGLVNKTLRSL